MFKVYTYPKFGDHCVCFGIVKEFVKRHGEIIMYTDSCTQETRDTNKRLYSSLKNVVLSDEPYNEEIHQKNWGIANTRMWIDKCVPWIENSPSIPDWYDDTWRFDVQWYYNARVNFRLKWDNFYYERNIQKEKEAYYDILGLKDNEEFIFIQEDKARNFILKKDSIRSDIKWINFSDFQDINILDVLFIIERAKEVHTFNTGILTFVDLMNINHESLNYHKYLRPMIFEQPVLLLNWNIIK